MVDYRDFDLYTDLLQRYYSLCSLSLDTVDFVSESINLVIQKRLFKKFKQKQKLCEKEYKRLINKDKELSSAEKKKKNKSVKKTRLSFRRFFRKFWSKKQAPSDSTTDSSNSTI